MNPADLILILVLAAIGCGAVFAIIKAKKSGRKCIGCPGTTGDGSTCGGKCGGCKGCGYQG